ncbi:hypothetical protein Q5P01_004761 [Channa striata]|uniref:Uncharacterized protein n=1 Tax=Channa striata TaxID=64152 RepID=A0AA88NEW2_CHASR|nr:hypothetical protein Q5P01_004761 [Channa striata]
MSAFLLNSNICDKFQELGKRLPWGYLQAAIYQHRFHCWTFTSAAKSAGLFLVCDTPAGRSRGAVPWPTSVF